MRWALAVILASGLPAMLWAGSVHEAPHVTLVEYGVFCVDEAVTKEPAPNTEAGFIGIIDTPPRLVLPGTIAPAMLGVSFGVRWQMATEEMTDVEIRVVRQRQRQRGPGPRMQT